MKLTTKMTWKVDMTAPTKAKRPRTQTELEFPNLGESMTTHGFPLEDPEAPIWNELMTEMSKRRVKKPDA